jgi:hypothetical protein
MMHYDPNRRTLGSSQCAGMSPEQLAGLAGRDHASGVVLAARVARAQNQGELLVERRAVDV